MLSPTLIFVAISSFIIYRYIVHPVFLSPLSRIPSAHPLAPITSLWILYIRYTSKENSTIHRAHQQHGPVVRLAPNEISVNCIDGGVKKIYSGNFEKHRWYDQMRNFGNVPNMFATLGNKEHAARKRVLTRVYSKSYLQASETMEGISRALTARLLTKLRKLIKGEESGWGADGKGCLDLMSVMNALTMDFITAYQFGLKNCSDFSRDEDKFRWWMDVFHRRIPYGFWAGEWPEVEEWADWLGIRLTPDHVAVANKEIGDFVKSMCDRADADLARSGQILPENVPVVWQQVRQGSDKQNKDINNEQYDDKIVAASEMWDHLSAGQETSGITLSYVFFELSRHSDIQAALRAELQQLDPPLKEDLELSSDKTGPHPSPKALDALPLLDAILMETLRIHVAIPGSQPRLTPAGGCLLGSSRDSTEAFFVHGGVRVSSQAYSLHRDANVFSDPETWSPDRWLHSSPEKLKEMHRTFWAFSSGGRMCIGNNLATQELKAIIAAVISNFRVEEIEGGQAEKDMVQEDAFTAQPSGRKLIVRLREFNSEING